MGFHVAVQVIEGADHTKQRYRLFASRLIKKFHYVPCFVVCWVVLFKQHFMADFLAMNTYILLARFCLQIICFKEISINLKLRISLNEVNAI